MLLFLCFQVKFVEAWSIGNGLVTRYSSYFSYWYPDLYPGVI